MIGDPQSDNPWDLPPAYGGQTPPTSGGSDPSASIAQWYQQYLGRQASPWEIQSWIQGGTPIGNVEAAIRGSQEAQAYAARSAPSQGGTDPNVPPPTTVSNGAAPPTNVGGLIQPFGQSFNPPAAQPYPDAPTFTPPSMADAANDPGYQFSLDQGKRNLDSWLSAHGTFNDSSAAEALQQFGQGAAATQYGNVWNRGYQAWQGSLGPWQTNVARTQHDNDTSWQNAFNTWLGSWNVFKDQRDSTFNKQYQVATA